MRFEPTGNRVLVRVDPVRTTTESGIHLAPSDGRSNTGTVVSVGKGARGDDGQRIPVDFSEGDRVMFAKYGGTEMGIDSVSHVIIEEDDIFGRILEK